MSIYLGLMELLSGENPIFPIINTKLDSSLQETSNEIVVTVKLHNVTGISRINKNKIAAYTL